MINTFTASPVRFSKFDFDSIGTGAGVARYAHGLYFGDYDTAKHYLDSYEHLSSADVTYSFKGQDVQPNSLAHQVMDFITEHPDNKQDALEHFSKIPGAKKLIDQLLDENNEPAFEQRRGVVYEVKIPNLTLEELPDWNATPTEDVLHEITTKFYQETFNELDIDKARLKAIGVTIYDDDDFVDIMNAIYEVAYDDAIEDDRVPFSLDDYALRDTFWSRVRGDSTFGLADEFDEIIDPQYMAEVKRITREALSFDSETTYGEVYRNVAHALNKDAANFESNDLGKKLASSFLSSKAGIPGFVAPAIFGKEHANEIVIISRDVAESIRLTEISPVDEPSEEDKHSYSPY